MRYVNPKNTHDGYFDERLIITFTVARYHASHSHVSRLNKDDYKLSVAISSFCLLQHRDSVSTLISPLELRQRINRIAYKKSEATARIPLRTPRDTHPQKRNGGNNPIAETGGKCPETWSNVTIKLVRVLGKKDPGYVACPHSKTASKLILCGVCTSEDRFSRACNSQLGKRAEFLEILVGRILNRQTKTSA